MSDMTVLLLTSGIGSRLGRKTQFTNKSLLTIGDKPIISHIIEAYPPCTRFVVTLGYYGNHVKEFLQLAYPDGNFVFVDVDKYSGDGSSVAYSVLCARNVINGPFVFHACDTLVSPSVIPSPSFNWVGGGTSNNGSQYATIRCTHDDCVTQIMTKGEQTFDFAYIGLAGINDWEQYFSSLAKIYKAQEHNQCLSDVDVMASMLADGAEFKVVDFTCWKDTGNVASFSAAFEEFSSRHGVLPKIDESISFVDNNVIKFFHSKNAVSERVLRASILSPFVPAVDARGDNFYRYKYICGLPVSQVINPIVISELLSWAKDGLWQKLGCDHEQFTNACRKFYIEKTRERIDSFFRLHNLVDSNNVINGIKTPPISSMLSCLPSSIVECGIPCLFHGDFILDNIIRTPDGFMAIDWRNDFGGLTYGDMYYDLAKLNHSLIFGHDVILGGGFSASLSSGNNVDIELMTKHSLSLCRNILKSFVELYGLSQSKIDILTALIWINMSPLHDEKLGLFLFYFGKMMLYAALNGGLGYEKNR